MEHETWDHAAVDAQFNLPFFVLMQQAHLCHLQNFNLQEMEFCALSSIKTGCCPEDCAYCPQSGHYKTGVKKEKLLDLEQIKAQARQAKQAGAKRFCMGAAWRNPPKKEFPQVLAAIAAVKELGLETCATLGMLDDEQAQALGAAGLDYYNHNIDTSPDYYRSVITTRTFEDRINTIKRVVDAGIHVCCGGILGMGEQRHDRVEFLLALAALPAAPQSIPINQLMAVPGTPLAQAKPVDEFEFIRTIAVARMMFPKSKIRLSAGRENMSETMQAWCFYAGANSIFIGDKLLTAKNPQQSDDARLLNKLDIHLPTQFAEQSSGH